MEGPVHAACWPVQLPLKMDGLAEDRLQHQIRDIADSSTPVIVSITEDGLLLLHKAACVDKVVPIQLQLRLDVGLSKVEDESDAATECKGYCGWPSTWNTRATTFAAASGYLIGLSAAAVAAADYSHLRRRHPQQSRQRNSTRCLTGSSRTMKSRRRSELRLPRRWPARRALIPARRSVRSRAAGGQAGREGGGGEIERRQARRTLRASDCQGWPRDGWFCGSRQRVAPAAEVAAMASRLRSISFEAEAGRRQGTRRGAQGSHAEPSCYHALPGVSAV